MTPDRYTVWLHGCDDGTEAQIEASPLQYEFLKYVEATVNAQSTFGCQPTMEILNAATQ